MRIVRWVFRLLLRRDDRGWVGDDLREGKPTVLLARARAAATETQLEVLDAVGGITDEADVSAIQQVIVDTGALAATEQEIDELFDQALDSLAPLSPMAEVTEALTALAHFVVDRDA